PRRSATRNPVAERPDYFRLRHCRIPGCGCGMTETEIVTLSEEQSHQRDRLLAILAEMRRVAVAFSGGIDSTVVAQAAYLALGDAAVAVTADSASVARAELDDARRLAAHIGIRHRIVRTDEFQNPDYTRNDGSRCYFCKSELYSQIEVLLPELGDP